MLDRLFDFLWDIIYLFFFTTIVDEFEAGVVLRFGHYSRDLDPGLHFYWPFCIERVITCSVVPDATELNEQKFTIKDGTTIAVKAVVTYKVGNVKRHLLEVEDAETSMLDACSGVLRRHLSGHAWEELADPEACERIEQAAAAEMHSEALQWGIKIQRVRFPDLVRLDLTLGHYGVTE